MNYEENWRKLKEKVNGFLDKEYSLFDKEAEADRIVKASSRCAAYRKIHTYMVKLERGETNG